MKSSMLLLPSVQILPAAGRVSAGHAPGSGEGRGSSFATWMSRARVELESRTASDDIDEDALRAGLGLAPGALAPVLTGRWDSGPGDTVDGGSTAPVTMPASEDAVGAGLAPAAAAFATAASAPPVTLAAGTGRAATSTETALPSSPAPASTSPGAAAPSGVAPGAASPPVTSAAGTGRAATSPGTALPSSPAPAATSPGAAAPSGVAPGAASLPVTLAAGIDQAATSTGAALPSDVTPGVTSSPAASGGSPSAAASSTPIPSTTPRPVAHPLPVVRDAGLGPGRSTSPAPAAQSPGPEAVIGAPAAPAQGPRLEGASPSRGAAPRARFGTAPSSDRVAPTGASSDPGVSARAAGGTPPGVSVSDLDAPGTGEPHVPSARVSPSPGRGVPVSSAAESRDGSLLETVRPRPSSPGSISAPDEPTPFGARLSSAALFAGTDLSRNVDSRFAGDETALPSPGPRGSFETARVQTVRPAGVGSTPTEGKLPLFGSGPPLAAPVSPGEGVAPRASALNPPAAGPGSIGLTSDGPATLHGAASTDPGGAGIGGTADALGTPAFAPSAPFVRTTGPALPAQLDEAGAGPEVEPASLAPALGGETSAAASNAGAGGTIPSPVAPSVPVPGSPVPPVPVQRFDVEWGELGRALPRSIRVTLAAGGREAVLRLEPPELGAIRVELTLDGERLSTRIQAERPEVALRIEQQRSELQKGLESVGIRLDHLQVETRSVGPETGARGSHPSFGTPDGRRDGNPGQSPQGGSERFWRGGHDRSLEGGRRYAEGPATADRPSPSPWIGRLDRRV